MDIESMSLDQLIEHRRRVEDLIRQKIAEDRERFASEGERVLHAWARAHKLPGAR